MLGEAKDEIKLSDELWEDSDYTALRDQQEADFGLWGPHTFLMDKKQGDWENFTTNSPKVLSNKIIGLLSSAWMQLYIEDEDELRKKRKSISRTEQFANGCIYAADRQLTAKPSGKSIQAALSFFACIKGGTAKSVLLTEDDNGIKPNIQVYDPSFCQWVEGEDGLWRFIHRSYVRPSYLKRNFEKQIKDGFSIGDTGSTNLILMRTFWDKDEWKTAVNGEYIDGEKHNLGYVPVNVQSCGDAPPVQSSNESYTDTLKYAWMSVFANNRDIYDLESKLLSIETSKALESGKIKLVIEYNSNESDGKLPEGIEKLAYSNGGRNEVVVLDAAKGQRFGGMVESASNEIVDRLFSRIMGMDTLGGIDPIAQGVMNRSGSGTLADILTKNAIQFAVPFFNRVAGDCRWIAEESVRQLKGGKWEIEKTMAEGKDAKGNMFRSTIKPSDVVERNFTCVLVPDRLRDELQELGAAVTKIKGGITSWRTAMTQHSIVKDPDKERDIMDEELAANDPLWKWDKMAKKFLDRGDERTALACQVLQKATIEELIKQGLVSTLMPQGQRPKPPSVSPQMNAMRVATEPMNQGGGI